MSRPSFKTFQYSPIAFRIKSRFLCMAFYVLPLLARPLLILTFYSTRLHSTFLPYGASYHSVSVPGSSLCFCTCMQFSKPRVSFLSLPISFTNQVILIHLFELSSVPSFLLKSKIVALTRTSDIPYGPLSQPLSYGILIAFLSVFPSKL